MINFDYDYVTTAAGEAGGSGSGKIAVYIIAGVAALAVISALVCFIILFLKNRKKAKKYAPSGGSVFCFQCDNKYDYSLGKCPYCNKKNIRKRILYGRYRN